MANKADIQPSTGTDASPTASKKSKWGILIRRCLRQRVDKSQFQNLAVQLWSKEQTGGQEISKHAVACAYPGKASLDVLLRVYIESLLELSLVTSSDVLEAIAHISLGRLRAAHRRNSASVLSKQDKHDSMLADQNDTDASLSRGSSNTEHDVNVEIAVLEILTKAYVGRRQPKTPLDAKRCLTVTAIWMDSICRTSSATQDSIKTALDAHAPLLCDALGFFGLALLENSRIHHVIEDRLPPALHKRLAKALTTFITYWSQASPRHSTQINRLQQTQQALGLVEAAKPTGDQASDAATEEVAASMQLQNVMDLPLLHARGSMLVFIGNLVSGHSSISDRDLLTFLTTWFNGDAQMLAVNLIVGSFDNLASAMRKGESVDAMFASRSFLVNKVPLLLTQVFSAGYAVSMGPQMCIAQALSQVDTNLFPPPSLGLMSESVLPDIRQDFLFACALHSLIPAESITSLLGEELMTLPPSPDKLYNKDTLLQQCSVSPEKSGQIVKEIDNLNGNGGIIAQVIVELIRKACVDKDTMFLKTLCVSLSTKSQTLDLLVQFSPPAYTLQPLCNLLDGWHFEEDQGEYQPVYEEFASIFLFVAAVVYRFGLTPSSIGIPHESFVAKFLLQGSYAFRTEQMSAEQNSHLASWIKGLFDTDGITDEVTSSCRPQEFYLLLPTIMDQTVFAVTEQVLGTDTLKNGLEYLLEPFLLPSLIAAANWMAAVAPQQKSPQELSVMCAIIKALIKAPTSSSDATAMHNTILSIVSHAFTRCLQIVKQRIPNSAKDLDPVLNFLEPHLTFIQSPSGYNAELRNWLTSQGGIQQAFRYSFNSLTNWSTTIAMNPAQQIPRQYSPRLAFLSTRLNGARSTLRTLLEEVKNQTAFADGTAPLHLDAAAALVCADELFNRAHNAIDTVAQPDQTAGTGAERPESSSRTDGQFLQKVANRGSSSVRMSLGSALSAALESAPSLLKTDPAMAETIVRLHRRVNTVLTSAAATANGTSNTAIPGAVASNLMAVDATSIALATSGQAIDLSDVPLDMAGNTAGNSGIDLGADVGMQGLLMGGDDQQGYLGAVGTSDDADTFAGLGLEHGMDFGF